MPKSYKQVKQLLASTISSAPGTVNVQTAKDLGREGGLSSLIVQFSWLSERIPAAIKSEIRGMANKFVEHVQKNHLSKKGNTSVGVRTGSLFKALKSSDISKTKTPDKVIPNPDIKLINKPVAPSQNVFEFSVFFDKRIAKGQLVNVGKLGTFTTIVPKKGKYLAIPTKNAAPNGVFKGNIKSKYGDRLRFIRTKNYSKTGVGGALIENKKGGGRRKVYFYLVRQVKIKKRVDLERIMDEFNRTYTLSVSGSNKPIITELFKEMEIKRQQSILNSSINYIDEEGKPQSVPFSEKLDDEYSSLTIKDYGGNITGKKGSATSSPIRGFNRAITTIKAREISEGSLTNRQRFGRVFTHKKTTFARYIESKKTTRRDRIITRRKRMWNRYDNDAIEGLRDTSAMKEYYSGKSKRELSSFINKYFYLKQNDMDVNKLTDYQLHSLFGSLSHKQKIASLKVGEGFDEVTRENLLNKFKKLGFTRAIESEAWRFQRLSEQSRPTSLRSIQARRKVVMKQGQSQFNSESKVALYKGVNPEMAFEYFIASKDLEELLEERKSLLSGNMSFESSSHKRVAMEYNVMKIDQIHDQLEKWGLQPLDTEDLISTYKQVRRKQINTSEATIRQKGGITGSQNVFIEEKRDKLDEYKKVERRIDSERKTEKLHDTVKTKSSKSKKATTTTATGTIFEGDYLKLMELNYSAADISGFKEAMLISPKLTAKTIRGIISSGLPKI